MEDPWLRKEWQGGTRTIRNPMAKPGLEATVDLLGIHKEQQPQLDNNSR